MSCVIRVLLPLWFTTASNLIPTQTTLAAGLGLLPFFPHQLTAGQAGPGRGTAQEKPSASAGMTEASFSGSQQYQHTFPGLPAGGPLPGHQKTPSQPKGTEVGSRARKRTGKWIFPWLPFLAFLSLNCGMVPTPPLVFAGCPHRNGFGSF